MRKSNTLTITSVNRSVYIVLQPSTTSNLTAAIQLRSQAFRELSKKVDSQYRRTCCILVEEMTMRLSIEGTRLYCITRRQNREFSVTDGHHGRGVIRGQVLVPGEI